MGEKTPSNLRKSLRPGSGWHRISLNAPVWEHVSGVRIHSAGIVRMPGGDKWILDRQPKDAIGRLLIRVNGGSRRRGLMAWGLHLWGVNNAAWLKKYNLGGYHE